MLLALAPAALPGVAVAQGEPVETKPLGEASFLLSGNVSVSIYRLFLTDFDRSESILLERSVLMVIEEGGAKIWTRAGAAIDGVPIQSQTDTVYVTEGSVFSAPPHTRFRVRSTSCEPLKLLFVMVSD